MFFSMVTFSLLGVIFLRPHWSISAARAEDAGIAGHSHSAISAHIGFLSSLSRSMILSRRLLLAGLYKLIPRTEDIVFL
jgi:hypothetical protein